MLMNEHVPAAGVFASPKFDVPVVHVCVVDPGDGPVIVNTAPFNGFPLSSCFATLMRPGAGGSSKENEVVPPAVTANADVGRPDALVKPRGTDVSSSV